MTRRRGIAVRRPFWLEAEGGACSACLHLPPYPEARQNPVIVCPPFGYEYTHSHRSLLHLADCLAVAGFVALRLDYPATGDSQGNESTPSLLDRWTQSIVSAATVGRSLTGGGEAHLVGLRLGSLLAMRAAARTDICDLVAWHPVINGRRYLRELDALRRVSSDTTPLEEEGFDAGGFVLSTGTVRDLKAVDLSSTQQQIRGRALILERDDLEPDLRLYESLTEQGICTELRQVSGYPCMMAEPQYTVVPHVTLDLICHWLAADDQGNRIDLDRDVLGRLVAGTDARWREADTVITEEHVAIPVGSDAVLRGVLTTPDGSPTSAMILANSGSVHRVGPSRIYVELARALAGVGVSTLRLDLRNLGESRAGPTRDENHPYPSTAVEDVRLAIDWLHHQRRYDACFVGGLCSGAYAAFRAGLELRDRPVAGVLCVNPLTFRWQAGMSLDTPDTHRTTRDADYFARTVRRREKWLKLLRGEADTRYIVRFVLRRSGDHLRNLAEAVLRHLHLRRPRELDVELLAYASEGRPLSFVFSSRDPGYAILKSETGRTLRALRKAGAISVSVVEGADHTFSKALWRREAIDEVRREIQRLAG